MNYDAKKLFFAGFLATLAHTAFLYGVGLLRIPCVDVAGALGMMFTPSIFPLYPHPSWMMGMLVHFFLGSLLFPLAYGLIFGGRIRLSPRACGIAWGLILFCVGQFIVMPCLGMAKFFVANPAAVLTYLLGHLAYGWIFGTVAGASVYAKFVKASRRPRYRRHKRYALAGVR